MNLSLVIPISVIALAAGAAIAWQVTKAPTDDKPAKAETPADAKPAAPAEKPDPYVLKYTMKLIDEKTDKNLKDYEGKVVLMVNVASKCGYTKQYKGIEKLYETYKDKGLVILGFPANDFGGQEPGSNSEIQQFCTTNYSVTFPMFAKIAVTGDGAAPLFKQLTALDEGRPPSWNFNKYLIGKDGKYIAHYESRVKPDDVEFIKAVRDALGIKADEATPAPATSDKK